MKTFDRYKANLKYDTNYIYSYDTRVGVIKLDGLYYDKSFSRTTKKHLNYAAKKLNLELIYKKDVI